MQLMQHDGNGLAGFDPKGRVAWRGKLIVEDDQGAHQFQPIRAGDAACGQAGGWPIRIACEPGGNAFVRIVLNVSPAPGRVLDRIFLALTDGEDRVSLLHSGTKLLALPIHISKLDGVVDMDDKEKISSCMMILILRADLRRSWAFGIADVKCQDFSLFEAERDVLRAGYTVKRKLTRETAFALAWSVGPDPFGLLEAYGDFLRPQARPTPPTTTGWNSWDYYQGAVRMSDVRKEMAAINASPLKGKLSAIVIDLGWESRLGDWKPNRKFPAGYRKIAAEIKAAGFVPGIWTAPLLTSFYTPLARHRQHLLAQSENGSPAIRGENAALDFSRPAVQEFLQRLYGNLYEAGFRFFKVDYMYQKTIDGIGRWYDDRVGKAAMIRKGFEIMRAAVGEDSHILNCYGPPEVTLGLCDSSRLSVDIHNFWNQIKFNTGQIAARLWQNGRLWRVDPDFAIVRSADTTSDSHLNPPYQLKPPASVSEMQTWLSIVWLSAGNVFLSDSIARLNHRGLAMLGRLFPPLTQSARPLDLFLNKPPCFWLAQTPSGPVLGVFNWSDQEQPIVVPPGISAPSAGVDIWSGRKVTVDESTIMPPHTALLLKA